MKKIIVDLDVVTVGTWDSGKNGDSNRRNEPDPSPYAKTYKDTKSGKNILVTSGLPMVDDVGMPIDVGWQQQGQSGRFTEKNNLFKAAVTGAPIANASTGGEVL